MTSLFPITIYKTTLHSNKGGSNKDYHLVTIYTKNGPALLIKRWGKAGTWGQMEFVRGSQIQIEQRRNDVYREKTSSARGYEQIATARVTADDAADFITKLGSAYYYKLGDNLEYILPGASLKGQKQGTKVEAWDEVAPGKFMPAEKAPVAKVTTEAERYANNPLWGAFS